MSQKPLTLARSLPGMFQLPAQTHLLPHMPRSPGLHQEPGYGEGGQFCSFPLQVCLVRLRSHPASYRQDGTWRAVWVSAVLLPLPWCLLQVAGFPGCRHASLDAPAQVHHYTAGGIVHLCLSKMLFTLGVNSDTTALTNSVLPDLTYWLVFLLSTLKVP